MYRYLILPHFKKQLKRYAKKYHTLKESVVEELSSFKKHLHVHIGHGVYKMRIRTKEIQKGKSGSFRLYLLVDEKESYLIPFALFFKGDKENLSSKEVNDHLEIILFELQDRDE